MLAWPAARAVTTPELAPTLATNESEERHVNVSLNRSMPPQEERRTDAVNLVPTETVVSPGEFTTRSSDVHVSGNGSVALRPQPTIGAVSTPRQSAVTVSIRRRGEEEWGMLGIDLSIWRLSPVKFTL